MWAIEGCHGIGSHEEVSTDLERRAWDSNPRGRFRALAVFKTAAIGH
jgi:hypothetical protein